MVKKRIDKRICRDCRKPIIGRRIDALVCKDCRDKIRRNSSKRKHIRDREERTMKKVTKYGIKEDIEREKVYEILRELEKGPPENPKPKRDESIHTFGTLSIEEDYVHPFGASNFFGCMQSFEMRPFWEFINKKIEERLKEEKLKIRLEESEKNKFGPNFLTCS